MFGIQMRRLVSHRVGGQKSICRAWSDFCPPTAALGKRAQLRLVQRAWSVFARWVDSTANCCDSCDVNIVGEPDEGKPHVRFDEGRLVRLKGRTSRLLSFT